MTSPPKSALSAGSEVDAWCTRCKMDLGHRIVAMVGAAPKRVVCMTCGSEHNYRAPKSEAGAKTTRRKAAGPKRTTTKAAAREEWEAQVRSGKPLVAYSTATTFAEGQIVSHIKFGLGYVRQVTSPKKVIVAFEDGDRTLLHGS